MANRNLIPPPKLMEAFVAELDAKPSDDDVAGDRRGGLVSGTMVVLCGYSVGIKYGEYDEEDHYDDEADDEVAPRSVSKGDRVRKVEKRAFAKRGCIFGKHGLGF